MARVSAGEATVYVEPDDEQAYAEAIAARMDDEPERSRPGDMGPARVERDVAWPYQERADLGVYRCLVSLDKSRERTKA